MYVHREFTISNIYLKRSYEARERLSQSHEYATRNTAGLFEEKRRCSWPEIKQKLSKSKPS